MIGKEELLESLKPNRVEALTAANHTPKKWENGARDQALFASIKASVDYLAWIGNQVGNFSQSDVAAYSGRRRDLKTALHWIEDYEQTLSLAMLEGVDNIPGLNAIKGLEIYGEKNPDRIKYRSPTFAFNVSGMDPQTITTTLWENSSVVIFTGDFFAKALQYYQQARSMRASLLHYNTVQEVKVFLSGFSEAVNKIRMN